MIIYKEDKDTKFIIVGILNSGTRVYYNLEEDSFNTSISNATIYSERDIAIDDWNIITKNGRELPSGFKRIFVPIYDPSTFKEKSYGGSYDVEDNQYFTKEDITSFGEEVCEHLDETYPDRFEISELYMKTPTIIHMEVISKEGNEASAEVKIDMRKVKKPSDIMDYGLVMGDMVYKLRQKLDHLYKA